MSRRTRIRLAVLAAASLLAACVGPRVKPPIVPADAALLDQQAAREQALGARADWSLRGRLGVSDGRDSGSGSLEWSQRGDAFRFSVHAPVTGKTWTLSGDAGHTTLQGLREQPVEAGDAQSLLQRELGWHVPVAELTHWVRGLRASPDARIAFRADGLPAEIDEGGWKVQYLDYDTSRDPALPTRVFAAQGEYKVRLAIREWNPP
ncbi:lipoprotein insertase outer membrane protein LolB [Dokdonella ginsengisoli]|uniref:Outer-membrane lipoprotein LolB n=1 Tax=Dokdonella ginsengisoli TaxID=363846 RepID=A0ABV9R0S4_9GAMM